MKNSGFQFTTPRLVSLEFDLIPKFQTSSNCGKEEKINIELDFKNEVIRKDDDHNAIVELTVVVGSKDGSCPFYIKATEGARFRWDEKLSGQTDILLNQNAPALLLGYLRPIIATITLSTQIGAYNIPFIDFTNS